MHQPHPEQDFSASCGSGSAQEWAFLLTPLGSAPGSHDVTGVSLISLMV